MVQEFLIALGSNLGSFAGKPDVTLTGAITAMRARGITLRRLGRYFATPCFPAGAGPDYVNACAAVTFDGSAQDLLTQLHAIEADMGRERKQRWGSRSLDLDLLAQGDRVLPDPETFDDWLKLSLARQAQSTPDQLILPHPRLQERAFVLVPLMDVAPDWRHPVLGKTTAELCAALPEDLRRQVVAQGVAQPVVPPIVL